MPFWRGAVYKSDVYMYEWLWSALRMQEDCILRALNFKFSWGTQNPGSTLAQTGNDPQIEPQMIPNRK